MREVKDLHKKFYNVEDSKRFGFLSTEVSQVGEGISPVGPWRAGHLGQRNGFSQNFCSLAYSGIL